MFIRVFYSRDRNWSTTNSDQGPPGTEPGGDIEVSLVG